jgi:hypothetical protein
LRYLDSPFYLKYLLSFP